jgi:ribulose-phosphate 3-epimerase
VDGGITIDTIKSVADAGADTFVAGNAIFKSADYRETINKMREQLK